MDFRKRSFLLPVKRKLTISFRNNKFATKWYTNWMWIIGKDVMHETMKFSPNY
jgi:hypothetical protein